MKKYKLLIARIITLLAGIGFLLAGIFNGEIQSVLQKAVRVCLECIGIG